MSVKYVQTLFTGNVKLADERVAATTSAEHNAQ